LFPLLALVAVVCSAPSAGPNAAGPLAAALAQGPGGPILVITSALNAFTGYYAEILRAEGLASFAVEDISLISSSTLASYDVAILGEMPLTAPQVTMLGEWVNGGGNLIAMRPDKQLATLLGLESAASELSNKYFLVNTSSGPGAGIVAETIQFHGTADLYTLAGASSVATLYSDATTPTANPAVTLREVGVNGGHAASFAFDLAKSVIYTRQGNPAWAGQERDGVAPIRADDMFHGAPMWVDSRKMHIPQADEAQRLLANLITQINLARTPLPRLWYFPNGWKAVVIMTGDDHGLPGGTAGRFNLYAAASPPGCAVAKWECIRSTSYLYATTPLTAAQAAAYTAQGFEVSIHVTTNCANFASTAQLESFYVAQLNIWRGKYKGTPEPSTHRPHCIVWSDWDSQPRVEVAHGIRLDTAYYYYPKSFAAAYPGFFTGSGVPMRYAAVDGSMIDMYQATTQLTDESGQGYPGTIDALLDGALGPDGFYGAFTANMHTDLAWSAGSDAIIASAKRHNVPVISARQVLQWVDARNNSSFDDIAWDSSTGTLRFVMRVDAGTNGMLRALVPGTTTSRTLSGVTRDGVVVPYAVQTIKGTEYAVVTAVSGSYEATYSPRVADRTAADFNRGTVDGDGYVSQTTDGEVILKPAVAAEFSGGALPAGWFSTPWGPGGTAVVKQGAVTLDAAIMGTSEYYASGHSLEFSASFDGASYQSAGFGVDFAAPNVMIFTTYTGGALYARTVKGSMSALTPIPGHWLGSAHRYRIDWDASTVTYTIDGVRVATHSMSFGTTRLRPLFIDVWAGKGAVGVDWVRMGPYTTSTSFLSRIFDAGAPAVWGALSWRGATPPGTAMSMFVRTGETPTPDSTWSPFMPVASSSAWIGQVGRCAQYNARLSTTDAAQTPELQDVTLEWVPQ
jgi:hypothetical protein